MLGLPMYAYRDALADRSPSNVRDIARRAAQDRHDFYVTGQGAVRAGVRPRRARGEGLVVSFSICFRVTKKCKK